MEDNAEQPRRLDRTLVYTSRWVTLYRDIVLLPNGTLLDQYHILDFGNGSVAVIVEQADGQILMERITRYPTGTTTWELPAGGIDAHETPLAAAEREVREETGYATHDHTELYAFHPLNGISNTRVHIIHCRAGSGTGQIDTNEIVAVRWFSPQELRQMIQARAITDGLTLTGLLLYWQPAPEAQR